MTTTIKIRDMATDEVVHEFTTDLDPDGRSYERMMLGLLAQTDTDRFVVDEVPG